MSFEVSDGLAKELRIRDSMKDELLQKLDLSNSLESWTLRSNKGLIADQTKRIARLLPPKARVLDVGFGSGFSSLELGRQGFLVEGVEPSITNIEIATMAAKKFGINFIGTHATAEEMSRFLTGTFDAVYFNSSLHHCDDPYAALRNAYALLNEGGIVIFIEPTLKPWRSKSWFFRQLENNPIGMAHYGGNEHIYYNWEYQRMLRRAGFTDIAYSSLFSEMDLRPLIVAKIQSKIAGVYTNSMFEVAARTTYYATIERISHTKIFSAFYKWLSLGDGLWVAKRI
jgi:2-polyprenyl-3-methyl-5-hydroxy-6-metoxy-1,4-benzoquinol methylase